MAANNIVDTIIHSLSEFDRKSVRTVIEFEFNKGNVVLIEKLVQDAFRLELYQFAGFICLTLNDLKNGN